MASRGAPNTSKGAKPKLKANSANNKSRTGGASATSRADSGLADSEGYSSDDTYADKNKQSRKTSAKGKNEIVKVEIDLTNPEDLLNKMDMLNLTDEETEDLLKQAYKINRQLKNELKESDDPSLRIYTVSAPANRLFNKSSKGEHLPPIPKGRKHYSSDAFSRNQHSAGRKSSPAKRSAKPKPEWVD